MERQVIGKPSASLLTRAFKDERKMSSNGLTGPAPAFGSEGARGCGCSLRNWTYGAVDGVAFGMVRFVPLSIWPFLVRALPNGIIAWARTSFGCHGRASSRSWSACDDIGRFGQRHANGWGAGSGQDAGDKVVRDAGMEMNSKNAQFSFSLRSCRVLRVLATACPGISKGGQKNQRRGLPPRSETEIIRKCNDLSVFVEVYITTFPYIDVLCVIGPAE